MLDKTVKIFGVIVTICIGVYYITGSVLNWRQLRQQNEVKKSKNYE